MTARLDFLCNDEHWQAVLSQFGGQFDTLPIDRKIECFDKVNRRRSLHAQETDMLCDLVEKQRTLENDRARRKGKRAEYTQGCKRPPRDDMHAALRRAIHTMGGHKNATFILGLSPSSIWRWDSQYGRCPADKVERISELTGIPKWELRSDLHEEPKP